MTVRDDFLRRARLWFSAEKWRRATVLDAETAEVNSMALTLACDSCASLMRSVEHASAEIGRIKREAVAALAAATSSDEELERLLSDLDELQGQVEGDAVDLVDAVVRDFCEWRASRRR